MRGIDRWVTRGAREVARRSSRRGFLKRLAGLLVVGAAAPVLPVTRVGAGTGQPGEPDPATDAGDAQSCGHWRHCGIDGFLSACCGGTQTSCPPGTEMSAVTWLGTCRNPSDGREYVISYNDCCGKGHCGRCFCDRNEGTTPVYIPQRSNVINWCFGASSAVYHSTVALVVGVASVDE